MILDRRQLRVENVLIERNYHPLVRGLTFKLKSPEILIITGKNGSGKSTLLRCLAGFIKPKYGKILWGGQDIYKELLVYQQNVEYLGHKNGLYSSWSVFDNLKNFCKTPIIDEAIRYWQLDHLKNHNTNTLSAGQKRRLSLARLYCSEKSLFFLDEPMTSLDCQGKDLFLNWVNQCYQKGRSIIISLHDSEINKFPWSHIHLSDKEKDDD